MKRSGPLRIAKLELSIGSYRVSVAHNYREPSNSTFEQMAALLQAPARWQFSIKPSTKHVSPAQG